MIKHAKSKQQTRKRTTNKFQRHYNLQSKIKPNRVLKSLIQLRQSERGNQIISQTPRATYNVHRLQQTEPTPTAKVSKISFFSSALIIREQSNFAIGNSTYFSPFNTELVN